MKITITKEEIRKIEEQICREELVKARAYDGRFAPRITTDKKKEENKRRCRQRYDEE